MSEDQSLTKTTEPGTERAGPQGLAWALPQVVEFRHCLQTRAGTPPCRTALPTAEGGSWGEQLARAWLWVARAGKD